MTTKITTIPGIESSEVSALRDNAARDFFWTISSAAGQSVQTQTLVGTAPMVLLAIGETVDLGRKGKITSESLKNVWAPVAAASAAISMWDLGRMVGSTVGRGALLTASAFAGVFEGFTQWSVKYLADVATNKVTQEMWRLDPALMTKQLVKELLLNTTIGAVPGAMWNIVFTLTLSSLIGAGCPPAAAFLLTAFLVSQVVLAGNFTCGKAIDQASSSIDEWMDWDKQRKALQAQAEANVLKRTKELLKSSPELLPAKV